MRQEDYNDMMKTPEESLQLRQSNISKKLPECPICKSEYLGDGVAPCVECDNKNDQRATQTGPTTVGSNSSGDGEGHGDRHSQVGAMGGRSQPN